MAEASALSRQVCDFPARSEYLSGIVGGKLLTKIVENLRTPAGDLILAHASGLAELAKVPGLVVAIRVMEHVALNHCSRDVLDGNTAVVTFSD